MTKILLVEDDKSLREIYGVRLLAEGYDIISAGDGEEALAMAIKERPDLIVSDVMMPKISGFDMLDILRSTTETKNIKVIMMTALSSEEQRERGVSLGADRYLVKSQVGIEDVVSTVHEVLGDLPSAIGQAPLVSDSTPATGIPNGQTEVLSTTPQPIETPAPMPVAPPVEPTPVPEPPAPTYTAPQVPDATPQGSPITPGPGGVGSTLPQPTAPFSTPRVGSVGNRVIEPLQAHESQSRNLNDLMSQELETQQAHMVTPNDTPPLNVDTQTTESPDLPPVPPAPNTGA